jgi:putative hydrolase of HD superfamily
MKIRKINPSIAALDFFAEAGLLKKVKRSGWWVAGIKDPESVAEHSFRTGIIGLYLADMEGADPFKVMTMALFNDIHESRINDLHKMGHYYIDFKDAEKKVFADQMKSLNNKFRTRLEALRREYDHQSSRESLIARDADILECLLQAKEYVDDGYDGAKLFFSRAPKHLKTKSAKTLWGQIKRWNSNDWWQNVVKFQR